MNRDNLDDDFESMKDERDQLREQVARLRAALVRAKEDMLWMFGAWDGSSKDEDTARPHAHVNIAAIDAALAETQEAK